MKRVPSVAAVLLVLLVALLAAPSGASGQVPMRDSVTGTLTSGFGFGTVSWTINASSGPSGESPTGTLEARTIIGNFEPMNFQVTCLEVTGNRAVIGGRAVGFLGEPIVVQAYLIVVDEPDGVQDRILYRFFVNDPAAPATCAEFEAQEGGITPDPARFGSVVVTDARPFPTSKEQCKNGGWRDFPGFKNQGDCVRFVATGGKNPPGGH